MTQYNSLNVKFSNSQLNKLKSTIKNETEVTLKLSSNVVGDSNDENKFPDTFLLTNTQALKTRKAFANGSSANTKLSKTHLLKIGESGGFLGRLLGPLLKTGSLFLGNILKPLAQSVLLPLGLTAAAAAAATDAAIHRKMIGSGFTTLIISNEEMNDIMEKVKSIEDSGLLIKQLVKQLKTK